MANSILKMMSRSIYILIYILFTGLLTADGFTISQIEPYAFENGDLIIYVVEPIDNLTECTLLIGKTEVNSSKAIYWGEGLDKGRCGFRMINLQLNDSNSYNVKFVHSDIVSRVGFNLQVSTDIFIPEIIHLSFHEGKPVYLPTPGGSEPLLKRKEYRKLPTSGLRKTSKTQESSYCEVIRPDGTWLNQQFNGECNPYIGEMTSAHVGLWKIRRGIERRPKELEVIVNITLIEDGFEVGWRKSIIAPNGIDLYCNIKSEKPVSLSFCRFVRTKDELSLRLDEDYGQGGYVYHGKGLDNGQCGLTIISPKEEDLEMWRCQLGRPSITQSRYQIMGALISPNEKKKGRSSRDSRGGNTFKLNRADLTAMRHAPVTLQDEVIGQKGKSMIVGCMLDTRISHCVIRSPSGEEFSGENIFLSDGECRVTIQSLSMNHHGIWTCIMNPQGQLESIQQKTRLEVSDSPLYPQDKAVVGVSGQQTILLCRTVFDVQPDATLAPKRIPISRCSFLRPDGVTLDIRSKGKSENERYSYIGNGEAAGECGLLINFVSPEDQGIWKCAATLQNKDEHRGMSSIELSITESKKVFPSSIRVHKNQEVVARIAKSTHPLKQCVVTDPDGQKIYLNDDNEEIDSSIQYWGSGLKYGECGFRLKTSNFPITKNHEAWFINDQVVWIQILVPVQDTSAFRQLSVQLGDSLEIGCNNSESDYCLLIAPGESASEATPSNCQRKFESVTPKHLGNWTCITGSSKSLYEHREYIQVLIKDISLITGWENSRSMSNSLDLFCNLANVHLKFCRFVSPSGESIRVADGLGHGRYSYRGSGLANGDCGLTILSNNPDDIGQWKCFVGVGDDTFGGFIQIRSQKTRRHSRSVNTPSEQTELSNMVPKTTKIEPIFIVQESELSISCQIDTPLQYCWMLHPNGTHFTLTSTEAPVTPSNDRVSNFWYMSSGLSMGVCGITIAHASLEDTGEWTCHMGTSDDEIQQTVNVTVTATSLATSTPLTKVIRGSSAEIVCFSIPRGSRLAYCRAVRPDGFGFNLARTGTIMGKYTSSGLTSIENGDCRLRIESVSDEDIGNWHCAGKPSLSSHTEGFASVRLEYEALSVASIGGYSAGAAIAVATGGYMGWHLKKKRRYATRVRSQQAAALNGQDIEAGDSADEAIEMENRADADNRGRYGVVSDC